jgi:DNA-binding transcriptional MerR regulator
MATLYTPKQAADLLGISPSAVRLYTNTYARHLSTEATSNPRRLTDSDLRMIAYVVSKTSTGQAHERVLAHLATEAGQQEYDAFEWDTPDTSQEANTALVPVAQLQAAQALMLDAQRREQEAIERAETHARELREQAQRRERELLDQVNRLQREMGKAEGKIESLEAQLQQPAPRPQSWWARLLGGGRE